MADLAVLGLFSRGFVEEVLGLGSLSLEEMSSLVRVIGV